MDIIPFGFNNKKMVLPDTERITRIFVVATKKTQNIFVSS